MKIITLMQTYQDAIENRVKNLKVIQDNQQPHAITDNLYSTNNQIIKKEISKLSAIKRNINALHQNPSEINHFNFTDFMTQNLGSEWELKESYQHAIVDALVEFSSRYNPKDPENTLSLTLEQTIKAIEISINEALEYNTIGKILTDIAHEMAIARKTADKHENDFLSKITERHPVICNSIQSKLLSRHKNPSITYSNVFGKK